MAKARNDSPAPAPPGFFPARFPPAQLRELASRLIMPQSSMRKSGVYGQWLWPETFVRETEIEAILFFFGQPHSAQNTVDGRGARARGHAHPPSHGPRHRWPVRPIPRRRPAGSARWRSPGRWRAPSIRSRFHGGYVRRAHDSIRRTDGTRPTGLVRTRAAAPRSNWIPPDCAIGLPVAPPRARRSGWWQTASLLGKRLEFTPRRASAAPRAVAPMRDLLSHSAICSRGRLPTQRSVSKVTDAINKV